jgi:organic radical activating enzyme
MLERKLCKFVHGSMKCSNPTELPFDLTTDPPDYCIKHKKPQSYLNREKGYLDEIVRLKREIEYIIEEAVCLSGGEPAIAVIHVERLRRILEGGT